MKVFLKYLIFLASITYSASFCYPEAKNVEVKLKNDILCHYKSEERPNQLDLKVELNYGVNSFTFDESTSILTLEARILHRWEDLRLRWEENDYAGIKIIHVNSDNIWIPRLFINDSFHHYGLGECHPTECILKSNGQVGCWIPCVQKLDCDADFSNWPFDSHICKVAFKIFYMYENVVFDTSTLSGQVVRNTNNEWKLSSMRGFIDAANKNAVKFSITIKRHSGTIYKHVVVPIYCLIALTLAVLWIKPESYWRLIFCGLNIYLHFELMDRVWWQFPSNGASKNVPKILKSMILMLTLSTIALIESILLKIISTRYDMPPTWGQKITIILNRNSITKYVMLSQPTEALVGVKRDDDKAMNAFMRIIDRTLFLIYSVIFLLRNLF